MSCNSLWIPTLVVLIQAQKVFSLGHIYFLRDKHVPVEFLYMYFTRKVNLTKREQLFLIFNQMLSNGLFCRLVITVQKQTFLVHNERKLVDRT